MVGEGMVGAGMAGAPSTAPLLEVRGLSKSFPRERDLLQVVSGRRAGALQAVRDVSFSVQPAETLASAGGGGAGRGSKVVGWGKSVAERVCCGWARIHKKKKNYNK